MMRRIKSLILGLLDEHRVMTLATNRPDGWPQATMVGYVNDGFLLYCFVARNTQKYANIKRDPRISIAIGTDAPNPIAIKGLSLAGHAAEVTDPSEFNDIAKLRLKKYPEYAQPSSALNDEAASVRISPNPPPENVALLRIAPDFISVLDYSQGFGHSELVTFSDRDLDVHVASLRHRWSGDGMTAD
jgi:nitroimidazol reductase NimA-like FMN-containing flavoprotein (pyridoxamine 5'-phosphate oxidase superfamily)